MAKTPDERRAYWREAQRKSRAKKAAITAQRKSKRTTKVEPPHAPSHCRGSFRDAQKLQLIEIANMWPGLSPLARRLAIYLIDQLHDHRDCFLRREIMVEALDASASGLRYATNALEAVGLWVTSPGTRHRPSHFTPGPRSLAAVGRRHAEVIEPKAKTKG